MRIEPICCLGSTPAVHYAAHYLKKSGLDITEDCDSSPITILLDIPALAPDGRFRDGREPACVLKNIPQNSTVIGGNLHYPIFEKYTTVDLLRDEYYLAENAAITAQCSLAIAAQALSVTLARSQPLILGWGRIGKCLAGLLKAIGAKVTVCARKCSDRAMLAALGYFSSGFDEISLTNHRLIINTIPAPVLTEHPLTGLDAVILDLAPGSGLQGPGVIPARGLPGIHAPESSGMLIAETILRLIKEGAL